MSVSAAFIEELRGRLSLGQVVGRKVMWDARKSNPGKGDLWAPCPFHQEKSASFHVDDRKGFYYCFGCHAKGDAFTFVRETENVGFMEAVEILAREAGMPVPARDPQAQAKADYRSQLADVMEQAVQFFRLQLQTGTAAEARAYLARRGLDAGAIDRWDIGFAADTRQGLFKHLTGKGIAQGLIVDAGLAALPDGGGTPYDRFRGRIIFPIRDARGRAIGLGGRAMDPQAPAKYYNSPETQLFDKGRALFNHGPAREAAGKGQMLVVAEGYMDVIALSEAGFGAAVAPLGTAITEDQLRMIWRIAPEPVIALDGDNAGLNAAMRLIDVALPLLEAGQSLRFALMPQGQDPDDLLRAQGAGAMRALLEQAVPMVHLLWRRATEGKNFDSPERKAALDKVLRAQIDLIKDPSIRQHYAEEIRRLRWELFGQRRGAAGAAKAGKSNWTKGKWTPPPAPPMQETKASALATDVMHTDHLREAVILATLIVTPDAGPTFEHELERITCADPDHEALRRLILRHLHDGLDSAGLRDALQAQLGAGPLEKLFAQRHVAISPAVRQPGDGDVARMCLAEELAKLNARRGQEREIAEAMEDMAGLADEGLTWRLGQAAQALDKAGRGDTEDRAEYETGANGARIKKDEVSALDQLLGGIIFSKDGRHRSE